MEKIGLFGGTFNPPHLAHLALAQCAIDTLVLDRLYWIPCKPWQKAGQAIESAQNRSAMIRLMIADDQRMELDTSELDREGDTYTIDTIADFRERFPETEIYFLMGSDQWTNFHTWKAWEDVLRCVQLVIVTRNGDVGHCHESVQAFVEREKIRIRSLEMPAMDVSSQEIRDLLAKDGTLFDKLAGKLSRDVYEYITSLGLYLH